MMPNCPKHNQQLIAYLPQLKSAVCSQCHFENKKHIHFNNNLQQILTNITNIQHQILQQFIAINIENLKQTFTNLFGPQSINQTNPILTDLNNILKLEEDFWYLPETLLISDNQNTLNYDLLIQYEVIGNQNNIDNLLKIKAHLMGYLQNLKNKVTRIRQKMQETKQKQKQKNSRDSEPFLQITQAIYLDSDDSELAEIGVPLGVDLEDINKELVKLIGKRKSDIRKDQSDLLNQQKQQNENTPNNQNKERLLNGQNVTQQNEVVVQPQNLDIVGNNKIDSKQQQNQISTSYSGNNARKDIQKDCQQVVVSSNENTSEECSQQQIDENIFNKLIQLKEFLNNKNYKEAILLVDEILAIQPNYDQVLQIKAKIQYRIGQKRSSENLLSQLFKRNKDNQSLQFDMSWIHLSNQNYQNAGKIIDELFRNQQQQRKAKDYILKGDYLLQSLSKSKLNKSKVEIELKQIMELYKKAQRLQPKNVYYKYRQVLCYQTQKKYEMAWRMIKQCLEQDPQNLLFLKNKSLLQYKKKDLYPQSLKTCAKILQKQKTEMSINNYAVMLFLNNRRQDSQQQILLAFDSFPDNPKIILNCLNILSASQKYQKAFQIIKDRFPLLKSNAAFVQKSCQIALGLKDTKSSEHLLNLLTQVRKDNPNLELGFQIAYYTFGYSLKNQNIINEGIKTLKKLIKPNKNEQQMPKLWNCLGLLNTFVNEDGLKQFQNAKNYQKSNKKPQYMWNYAVCCYNNKHYKQAEREVNHLIQDNSRKNIPERYFLLHLCTLIKLDRFKQAQQTLKQYNSRHSKRVNQDTFEKLKANLLKMIES